MSSPFSLDAYLAARRALVEAALAERLDAISSVPPRLHDAMRYSLLAGGKRLRPVLALAACEAVCGQPERALDAACALEFIHTYSLIHDDLPAMDDDDFRRGRPTAHKVYGEGLAILAGDALLTEAFGVAAAARAEAAVVAAVVRELARATGAAGMVGGQVIDIVSTGRRLSLAELETLHRAKTGELLAVSVRAGARFGGATDEELAALGRYGDALGLGFQIIDDVLDVTADLATLGKDPGSDQAAGKTTFVDLLGVEGARARAHEVMAEGLASLERFGERALPLRELGRYAVERDR